MVKLTNTADACDRSGVKCVVFGKAKVGKTTLIATAPDPIIFSSERGLLPLRSLKLPVIALEKENDIDEAFAWLAQSAEARRYRSVCWDSVTDTCEDVLMYEKRLNKTGRNGKVDKWAPYNALADRMIERLREARNSVGRNWYFVCQEEIIQTPENTRQAVPSLPGKALLQNLPYLFDGIFQLVLYVDPVTGEETRMLKTRGDNITLGGDRSGNLDHWEAPHLGNVFAKMLA